MISKILFFVVLGFAVFCCRVSKQKFGIWGNHYVYTNIWWFFVLAVSLFFNNYIQPISIEVYCIFYTGLSVFNCTVLFANIAPLTQIDLGNAYAIKKRRIVEVIVLLAILPIAYKNLTLLLSGTEMWVLNDNYWHNEDVRGSYWELFYKENIIEPLSTILITTCFFNYYKDKKSYSYIITILIGVSLSFLSMLVTGGGRSGLINLVFVLLLSFYASKILHSQKIMVKINLKPILCIIIMAFIGIQISSVGRGQDEGLYNVLVDRLTTSPALFEGWYQKTNICNGYSWGTSMFETPLAILAYPFKIIGMGNFERISSLEQESMFAPALAHNSNAGVTAYLYYMRDFGLLGVIVGPYIVAQIYNYLWKLCKKELFLMVFYFTAICLTCINTIYPFRRGFVFVILFVFLFRKFILIKR